MLIFSFFKRHIEKPHRRIGGYMLLEYFDRVDHYNVKSCFNDFN